MGWRHVTWPFWRKLAQPLPAERPAEPARRVKYDEAAAMFGSAQPDPRAAFELPKPFPGVVPDTAPTMAADSAISAAYQFAGTGLYGEGLNFLGYSYLSELAQRPEYRQISETIAREMTRKWIRLHATGDDQEAKRDRIAALNAAFDRFQVQHAFRRMAELDGFFGRAQLFLDTGDAESPDELKTPLTLTSAKIGIGGLKRLVVVEPVWTYPSTYNTTNPLGADFYKPLVWFVMGRAVHRSRLLTFVSREMPDLLKPAYQFGGLSLSQMAKPYVDNWIRTRQSVSDLIKSFSVSVLKTKLGDLLQLGSAKQLFDRVKLFIGTRDNRGVMVVDKDGEDLSNVSTPLGTLDKLQAQAQEQMASVSGIPLVKLLGVTPSGLNASSDGEVRVFYDAIAAMQEHLFGAHLKTVMDIIQLSEFGDIDPEIGFSFEPLWQMSEAERAALRKTNADTAAVYIEKGVLAPADERLRLAAEDGGAYDALDPEGLPEAPDDEGDDLASEGGLITLGADAEFEETDHPRAPDGKFGAGGSLSQAKVSMKGNVKAHLKETKAIEKGGKKVLAMADGSALPDHIAKLKLPPAWSDVRVSDNPDSPVQAVGKDSKGRVQSVYSLKHSQEQAAAKFSRVEALRQQFASIMAQNDQNRSSSDVKVKDCADCLDLIAKTGIRPGSDDDTGAEKKAFGATTLKGEHVKVGDDGSVSLQFVGKKGVSLDLKVEDQGLAERLKDRAASAGAGGTLFPTINDKRLLDYTHAMGDGSFKTKDFRTHLGTQTAYDMVYSMPVPSDEKARIAAVKQVARAVSKKLGNTPSVALESYINPACFAGWQEKD